MTIDHNSFIPFAVILSATLIGVVALIRNTPGSLIINLCDGKSFILEGKAPSLDQTKIDCFSTKKNNQLPDCDIQ